MQLRHTVEDVEDEEKADEEEEEMEEKEEQKEEEVMAKKEEAIAGRAPSTSNPGDRTRARRVYIRVIPLRRQTGS